MPIIDLEPTGVLSPVDTPAGFVVTPREQELRNRDGDTLGFLDGLGAAFRQDNTVGASIAQVDRVLPLEREEDFSPWESIKGTKYEKHFDSFADIRNSRAAEMRKQQIDLEEEDRRVLHALPWYKSVPAQILAGGIDLPTALPGGAFVRGARGGLSIAGTAGSVAAASGAATTVQEAALHGIQSTRPMSDSYMAVGGSVLLGGLLGAGGASLLSRAEWNKAVTAIDRQVNEAVAQTASMPPASVGAMAVTPIDLERGAVSGSVAGATAAATRRLTPGLRLTQSDNPATRDVAMRLFEVTHYLRGNEDGLASPIAVETLRKEWNNGLMRAVDDSNGFYREYRKAGGQLSRSDFNEQVGMAMRRNDEHVIPEVARAAQSWRKSVFDPLKEAAIEAKLLPQDVSVDTAASYFSRMWNRKRLVAEEPHAKAVFNEWISNNLPRWMSDFDAETAAKSAKLKDEKLAEFLAERRIEREARFGDSVTTKSTINEISNEVFNKLVGRGGDEGGRPEFITITARGPLKERTFNIPDELVERWLESDAELVGRRYQRIMSSDVELTRMFGSPDMKEALQKVRDGYAQLRNGVTDEKQLKKLSNAEKSDIEDLQAVRDIMRGTYLHSNWENKFGRVVRFANALQYVLKMGGVVLSSLTEPVRIVAAKGLLPFMGDGMAGLTNLKAARLSVEEARLAGNITDKILSERLTTMADLADVYTSRNVVEKFMDNMTNVASQWNGIRLWTDGMKMLASTMIQNQILRGTGNFAKASAKDKRYLAFLGIDESMAGRIAKQFEQHGETSGSVHIAGTENWTDEVAKRAYRAALNKDLDSMVVTRGAADLPLFANTPLGKLIFQFNTFNIASHQRVLLRGLQEGHGRFLGSLSALTGMGMLVTYLQALASNRVDKLPNPAENPGWWIAEGLDRSGVFSIPFQVANAFEKIVGVNPIKAPIKAADAGQAQSARLANRNDLGAALGPTAGTIQDVGNVLGIPASLAKGEEIKPAQKNAAERLLPFNSYAGVRQILKYLLPE